MLQLTPDQWQALGQAAEQAYTTRLTGFLRDAFPEAQNIPEQELQDEVGRQIPKAQGYGFKAEDEIAVYMICAWQLGTDFDKVFPAAAHMLNSPDYTPEQKRDWLTTWTVAIFDELERED